MTIKKKALLWFLIPSVIIATATASFCYFYTRHIIEQNIFDKLEIAASKMQVNAHVFLEAKRGRILDFSSDGFIRDCTEVITKGNDSFRYYSEHLNAHLVENKLPIDSSIVETFVVDLEGKIISSTTENHVGGDVSGEVFFTAAIKRGSGLSDLCYSKDFGQNTIEVSRLLLSKKEKEPVGVIVNRHSGDVLAKVAYSAISKGSGVEEQYEGLGETGEIYIVNNNRLMITESRFVEDAILKQVVDTEGVEHAFDNGVGMTSIYPDYRGNMTLGVSKYFEEMDWVILAEKDVSEAFAPVVWLRNFFIIIGASGIIIMVVISILISTGITKSIKKLIRGTKRIAGGDLERPIKIDEMDGEMKELGVSFNVMMKELGKSTHENQMLYLQVKKGRDEWRKTFDTITDIISIHDENHKILMANRAFYEKFKIDKKELSGKLCTEIFFGIDSNRQCCPLDKSKKSAQPESEIVEDSHMGGVFIKSTYPMKDKKGKIYAYVHIAKDITLQKELQAELIEKASELEKVNKELENFIYLTSHDLKEPLFAISGYTSRLSNAYNDAYDEKGRKYIDRIKANTEKMNQRIQEIMEVLKAGKVEYNHEECDSSVIVNDVIKALDERILENRVKISINDDLPMIYCDQTRIKDVFSNLITNAVKFIDNDRHAVSCFSKTPEASLTSELSLSSEDKGAGVNTQTRNVTIGYEKEESYYKFFVEDTGIGIQKSHQDQIFKIFKRLNDIDVEGSGVGLAIVKRIVEQHKGNIWVESPVCEGRGSRFCFTIPAYKM